MLHKAATRENTGDNVFLPIWHPMGCEEFVCVGPNSVSFIESFDEIF